MIIRRQSLKRLLDVAAATITAPMINRGWFQRFAEDTTKILCPRHQSGPT
jgi:hypothetical protein